MQHLRAPRRNCWLNLNLYIYTHTHSPINGNLRWGMKWDGGVFCVFCLNSRLESTLAFMDLSGDNCDLKIDVESKQMHCVFWDLKICRMNCLNPWWSRSMVRLIYYVYVLYFSLQIPKFKKWKYLKYKLTFMNLNVCFLYLYKVSVIICHKLV